MVEGNPEENIRADNEIILVSRESDQEEDSSNILLEGERAEVYRLQKIYLTVYGFMVAGDWLQGPYIYALYDAYGYSRQSIAVLFVAGFVSSMLAGTLVGSLADRLGRRRFVFIYALLYIASCLTKHLRSYWWLLLGRILGGMATSLLFSVFEAWAVCEHLQQQMSTAALRQLLSSAMLLNSAVAVVSGLAAEQLTQIAPLTPVTPLIYAGGYLFAFDLTIVILVVGSILLFALWKENYGVSNEGIENVLEPSLSAWWLSSKQAFAYLFTHPPVLLLGTVQSLFEAAMYSFVFMWTPALTSETPPPHGIIFSIFMFASMVGSQLPHFSAKTHFTLDLSNSDVVVQYSFQRILVVICIVSALALAVGPICSVLLLSTHTHIVAQTIGFFVFEVCVGAFYPTIGFLRSAFIPERFRATLYNFFRIPLNAFVASILIVDLSVSATFTLCSCLLIIAACLQVVMISSCAEITLGNQIYYPISPS